jgi:Tol biopolymer transport system component
MALQSGTRVGPYEIADQIGSGGMGEVYRARDASLGRDVAIKVLPDAVAHDPDRLGRFEREAKALAALNHPNIAHIYGLERADGVPALVMELVNGETLADRIARGPIPLDDALTIARQIADALDSAHTNGIVHRDLKPANIKLRPDDVVKVLDFGLAKLAESPDVSARATLSPTITSPALATIAGVLLGTAAYMSPEQAKGREADKRSDVWAFGCVLYEMLTGSRAFAGDDVTETIAAVVKDRVDLHPLPTRVRRLVATCLERDPRSRLRDIGDAWMLLDDEPRQEHRRETRRGMMAAVATAAAATIALAGLAWVHFRETPQAVQRLHYTIEPVDGATMSRSTSFAVSPDGRFVAMAAVSNGRQQLWVRSLDALEWQPLPGTEGGVNPFWSPDGRSIGFFDGQRLRKIARDGGTPLPLCSTRGIGLGTWNRDDVILFSLAGPNTAGRMFRGSAAGGDCTEIPGVVGTSPAFLPDGARFLYRVTPGKSMDGLYLGSLDGRESRLIVRGAGNLVGFAPAGIDPGRGYLLFIRENTLLAQLFDTGSGDPSGDPAPIAQELPLLFGAAPASVSRSGVIVYLSRGSATNQLVAYDRRRNQLELVGAPGDVWEPSFSPDGRTIAYARFVGTGPTSDIWLWNVTRNVEQKLTTDPSRNDTPVWSHDGQQIVFRSTRGGQQDLWIRAADGSGRDEILVTSGNPKFPSQWTQEDVVLYSENAGGTTDIDLWSIPLSGARKPVKILDTRFEEAQAQLSPDGRWIAYTSNQNGQPQVYVAPSGQPTAATLISSAGGEQPRWRGDGRELFFVAADGKVMFVNVRATSERQTTFDYEPPRVLFDARIAVAVFTRAFQYDVRKDGQQFVVTTDTKSSRALPPLHVLHNWQTSRN